MRKMLLLISVVVTLFIFISCGKEKEETFLSGASLNPEFQQKYLVGSWIQPIPGNKEKFQGFILKNDGTAKSINMATLQYISWKIEDDNLVLTVKSIGNKTSSIRKEIYTDISLNETELHLKKGNIVYIYKRKK